MQTHQIIITSHSQTLIQQFVTQFGFFPFCVSHLQAPTKALRALLGLHKDSLNPSGVSPNAQSVPHPQEW